MINKASLVIVALVALVATFVSCQIPPQLIDALADDPSTIAAKIDGHLVEAPVFWAPELTEERRQQNAEHFKSHMNKLLKLAEQVIIKREFFSASAKIYGIVGSVKDLMKAGLGSPKYDISRLVRTVLNTKPYSTSLSDQEIYERAKTFLNGVEELIRRSPVGWYPGWNKLTIDGQPLPVYLSPVIHWLRENRFGVVLSALEVLKNTANKFDNWNRELDAPSPSESYGVSAEQGLRSQTTPVLSAALVL